MSRVINPDSAGKLRTQLSKAVVLAIRELMKQGEPDDKTRDLAAFIGTSLITIAETIDTSVQAWEKRGYWVKADRFRMEWDWASLAGNSMVEAVKKEDWMQVAIQSAKIAQKFTKITIAEHNRIGTPWTGAWRALK